VEESIHMRFNDYKPDKKSPMQEHFLSFDFAGTTSKCTSTQ